MLDEFWKTNIPVIDDARYAMRYQTTRRRAVKAGVLIAGGAAFAGNASARPRNFVARLSTDAHDEAETNARGLTKFQLRDDGLRFRLTVANIEDVTMAHIHLESVTGPVAVWLHDFDSAEPSLLEGRVNGVIAEGTITDDHVDGPINTLDELVAEIDGGNAFVNVHTDAFPGGEIGGLIQARN